jgi:hypothetical protein
MLSILQRTCLAVRSERTPLLGSSAPQDAPQRDTGVDIQQRNLSAVSNVKTSAVRCLPDSPAVSTLRSRTPADSQLVPPTFQLNVQLKHSELPKVPRLGSSQRCPLDIVNVKPDLSTSQYSPRPAVVLTPPTHFSGKRQRHARTVEVRKSCVLFVVIDI